MGGDLKIRVGIFSSVLRKSICVRFRECNFISLMDFDARNSNPTFFANYGTENWIIHEFEVMKANVTRARRGANDPITLKIESTTQMQKGKMKKKTRQKEWEKKHTTNDGKNDGIRTIQEQRYYSITIDSSSTRSLSLTSYRSEQIRTRSKENVSALLPLD